MLRTTFFLFLSVFTISVFGQNDFYTRLSDSAFTLTKQNVTYDPGYFTIAYPGGDVPAHKGVCTDAVIRAYRKLGIDLQKEVHKDMKNHFSKYPQKWGLSKPDKNIDHRRVPNLMTFFSRHGTVLKTTKTQQITNPAILSAGTWAVVLHISASFLTKATGWAQSI